MPAYRLIFAFIAARQGKYPSPWLYSSEAPYQWGAVIFVWTVLGVAVLLLHRIIDPLNYNVSSPRFGKAFGFSVLLLLPYSLIYATDLPPVLYLPGYFVFVTAGLMLIGAAIETTVIEIRKRRNNE